MKITNVHAGAAEGVIMQKQFDFEKKYRDFMEKIGELKEQAGDLEFNLEDELLDLENKVSGIREARYQSLSPWERVLLSRRPDRPGTADYIKYLCEEWMELHGDRLFSDDRAILGGIGLLEGQPVTVLGHRKGKNTRENLECNFGMPNPEGYRKVERLLLQAEK